MHVYFCESNPHACATDAGSTCEDKNIEGNKHDGTDMHAAEHDQVNLTEEYQEGSEDDFTPDFASYLPEDIDQVSNQNDLPCYNRYTSLF